MKPVRKIVKEALDSFFDVKKEDQCITINSEDTKLISKAIVDVLKSRGFLNVQD